MVYTISASAIQSIRYKYIDCKVSIIPAPIIMPSQNPSKIKTKLEKEIFYDN